MYISILLSLLSSPSSALAKSSIYTGHDVCSFSVLGYGTHLPTCHGDSRRSNYQDLDTACFGDVFCHRAANKPAQVVLSAGAESSSSQWSTRPKCIQLQNSTESYCVHTNTAFASGRGVSVFTSPENAEEVLKLPAFNDPHIHDDANYEPNPPYIARQLPGRGIGLIANRTLHRGDRIFSNTPTLMIEEEIFEYLNNADLFDLQELAVDRLPPRTQKLVTNLHGHFGGNVIEDIINTNAFAVELFDGDDETSYNIVLPEISRLNHDCRPNSHYYFDRKTLTHHVHALRTILPGEELTISYIDPAQNQHARLTSLKTSWGFPCGCSQCTASPPIAAASDDRIQQIADIREQLEDYTPNSKATTELADLMISLYEQERMWGPIAEAYSFAALEYNGVGALSAAQKYARLSVEVGLIYGGPHDEDVKQMEALAEDPGGHWSWMLRTEKSFSGQGAELGDEQS